MICYLLEEWLDLFSEFDIADKLIARKPRHDNPQGEGAQGTEFSSVRDLVCLARLRHADPFDPVAEAFWFVDAEQVGAVRFVKVEMGNVLFLQKFAKERRCFMEQVSALLTDHCLLQGRIPLDLFDHGLHRGGAIVQ